MGAIRIASGRLRGQKIKTPAEKTTRPLLSRLRQSLADILRPGLEGCRILDLFGGSGAIVFELISNGATSAVIVELDKTAMALIYENAVSLGLEKRVRVVNTDAIAAISALAVRKNLFDLVIVAPPYGLCLQQTVLDKICLNPVVKPGGTVIVQREKKEPVGRVSRPLIFDRTREYGRTVFDFYQRCD